MRSPSAPSPDTLRRVKASSRAISLLLTLGLGCQAETFDVARVYAPVGDPDAPVLQEPVIMLAGFMGSRLEDESGVVVWGEFFTGQPSIKDPQLQQLMAMPVADRPLSELRDGVTATEAMTRTRIGKKKRMMNAYPGIISGIIEQQQTGVAGKAEKRRGLRKKARRAKTYEYLFPYDWRRDISEHTAALDVLVNQAVDEVAAKQGIPRESVKIDMMGHSMGGLVLRYYLRYGTQPLPDDGSLPELTWAGARHARRVVIAGSPSSGSISAALKAATGDKPNMFVPRYPAGVMGTFPSLYQMLPRPRHALVIWADTGEPVDLYDVAIWERYGWGVFAETQSEIIAEVMAEVPAARRRDVLRAYMTRCLRRGEQFAKAMDVPAKPPAGTTLHLFAGDRHEMPYRVWIDRKTGKIVGTQKAWGDGLVTRRSALADEREFRDLRTRIDSPVQWSSATFVGGDHLSMLGDPVLVDNMLYLLLQAPVDSAPPPAPDSRPPWN